MRTGSTGGVKSIVKSDHDITLMHAASGLGHLNLVRLLIEHGTGVDAADEDGETLLHRAISLKNNYVIAKPLIQKRADVANVAVGKRRPLNAIFNNKMGRILTSGEDMGPDSGRLSIKHFLAAVRQHLKS